MIEYSGAPKALDVYGTESENGNDTEIILRRMSPTAPFRVVADVARPSPVCDLKRGSCGRDRSARPSTPDHISPGQPQWRAVRGCLGRSRQDRALGEGRPWHHRHAHLDDTSHRRPRRGRRGNAVRTRRLERRPRPDWPERLPARRQKTTARPGRQTRSTAAPKRLASTCTSTPTFSRPATRSISVQARSEDRCGETRRSSRPTSSPFPSTMAPRSPLSMAFHKMSRGAMLRLTCQVRSAFVALAVVAVALTPAAAARDWSTSGFGEGGWTSVFEGINAIAPQANGKIVLVNGDGGYLMRLLADGRIDRASASKGLLRMCSGGCRAIRGHVCGRVWRSAGTERS